MKTKTNTKTKTKDEDVKLQTSNVEPQTSEAAPADAEGTIPVDSEGMEAVTIVILSSKVEYVALAKASLKKYLLGVTAIVLPPTADDLRNSDVETLRVMLERVHTERVIVMHEGQLLLNPVTLYDCAQLTDLPEGRKPQMYHKSVLLPTLEHLMHEPDGSGLCATYAASVLPGVAPVPAGGWRESVWVLPIVSERPSVKAIAEYARSKKFAWVSPKSWTPEVVEYFINRFA